MDSWTNNCGIAAGIGDQPGNGPAIDFGWQGGGCPTRGVRIVGRGVSLDNVEKEACVFSGNWLWVEPSTRYTATLTLSQGTATLAVEGVGQSTGQPDYTGPYSTLWVGGDGRGDWPECSGKIDFVRIEPLP